MWGQLAIKALVSGALIALASEVARRSPGWGGLIAALPLTSLIALGWLWRDTHDAARAADFMSGTALEGMAALPACVLIALLLRRGAGIAPAVVGIFATGAPSGLAVAEGSAAGVAAIPLSASSAGISTVSDEAASSALFEWPQADRPAHKASAAVPVRALRAHAGWLGANCFIDTSSAFCAKRLFDGYGSRWMQNSKVAARGIHIHAGHIRALHSLHHIKKSLYDARKAHYDHENRPYPAR